MKETIAREATYIAKDWVALLLTGLGITLPVHEFIGGTLLAMAAASIMARHRQDPRKVWLTLATGAFFGAITAIFWPTGGLHVFGVVVPVQGGMLVSGFGSKWGVNIMGSMFDRVENKTDSITDRFIDRILPGDTDKNDKDENDADRR